MTRPGCHENVMKSSSILAALLGPLTSQIVAEQPCRIRSVRLVLGDVEQPAAEDGGGPGLIGVEEHQRERVFGLFQRGVSRDVPGTGAGLAIVAQVAERYGGRVWVEDREGGGARFILGF